MNIYQRIILVIGGIGLAFALFTALGIVAIVISVFVIALTFSGYIAFKSRK